MCTGCIFDQRVRTQMSCHLSHRKKRKEKKRKEKKRKEKEKRESGVCWTSSLTHTQDTPQQETIKFFYCAYNGVLELTLHKRRIYEKRMEGKKRESDRTP